MTEFAGPMIENGLLMLLVLLTAAAVFCYCQLRRLRARQRLCEEVADTLMQNTQGLLLNVHSIASRLPADDPTRQSIEAVISLAQDRLSEVRERIEGRCAPRGNAQG